MKQIWKEILTAAVMGILAPWLLLGIFEAGNERFPNAVSEETIALESTVELPAMMINVYIQSEVVAMPIEDYVTGVLLCELPESFSQEAKKAQAVVARTYALRTCSMKDKHPQQAVCISPACCQGYTAPEDYSGSKEGILGARRAAEETAGLVLLYEGELIDATYFSCSGGQTEDAVAVWGADIPYLRSVASPGEESATHFTDTVTFSVSEFRNALSISEHSKTDTLFGAVTYTNGGGVQTMDIAGQTFSGTELRTLLGLRSTAFTATAVGDNVIITTKGFGHRVGMSQYGAEAMAVAGKSFREILEHYYVHTQLVEYN